MNTEISQFAGDYSNQIGELTVYQTLPIGDTPSSRPFNADPPPAIFVPRKREYKFVKQILLDNDFKKHSSTTIYGVTGSGKSTLALALANDDEVKSFYSDGILWKGIGQNPDTLKIASDCIKLLGDVQFRATSTELATGRLRTLLRKSRFLIILDDVWNPDHVSPFRVVGAKGHLLITTRSSRVAKEIGGKIFPLEAMQVEESLSLLKLWAGFSEHESDDDRQAALFLADKVDHLPLGLQLIGASAKSFGGWAEYIKHWDSEVQHIQEGIRVPFDLSLKYLDQEVRKKYLQLGVFAKGSPIYPSVVYRLWNEDNNTLAILNDLSDQALLNKRGSSESLYFTFHDLFHDFVTETFIENFGEERLKDCHQILLDNYRRDLRNGYWSTLPDEDIYIHNQIVRHLEQAGKFDEIHNLLKEELNEQNAWYVKRERMGQLAGFLSDINRAWQLSENDYYYSGNPKSLGLQIRYALISSSINSLAENIPPGLLIAILDKRLWPIDQVLFYVNRIPSSPQKEIALLELITRIADAGQYSKANVGHGSKP